MGTGETREGTQQRQPFSKTQMGSVDLTERGVSLSSWGLLQGQRQHWMHPHIYSAMAHFKKSRQTFLPALSWRERPDGIGSQSPAASPVGPREPSSGKAWIQVCSQLKPADQGDFRPLGEVRLLSWAESPC